MAPQNQTEEAQVASPSNSKAPVPIKNALNLEVEHAKFEYPELLSTFPPTTDDPIPIVPYEDRALKANPTFKTLLGDATVTVTHLEPKTGTEISGLQLHELTDAQKDELALLIAHRGVVFFRGQKITADEMLELGSYYGPLHINLAHTKKDPELLVVENAVETSAAVLKRHKYDPVSTWHADVSYERQPPAYTLFKVLTTPEVGGDTLWASAYEAFDRLTPAFQRFVEGLVALHSGKSQAEHAVEAGHIVCRPVVEFEHPVVRTHPVTKRKALFVNAGFTKRIKNLSTAESDAVLRFLFKHIAEGQEFQVRYHWTKDAVAIWDNRSTFHYATFDYLPGNRHAVRVTPHGEIPYFDADVTAP